ncbi:nuclear pore protein 84/107, partial [Kipferlia bialata]|eukprot:g7002.t1
MQSSLRLAAQPLTFNAAESLQKVYPRLSKLFLPFVGDVMSNPDEYGLFLSAPPAPELPLPLTHGGRTLPVPTTDVRDKSFRLASIGVRFLQEAVSVKPMDVGDARLLETLRTAAAEGRQVDPDTLRANGYAHLLPEDGATEMRVLRGCLSCLRAGNLQAAITLCSECGQSMRAAVLAGAAFREGYDPRAWLLGAAELVRRAERETAERGGDMANSTGLSIKVAESPVALEAKLVGILSGLYAQQWRGTRDEALWAELFMYTRRCQYIEAHNQAKSLFSMTDQSFRAGVGGMPRVGDSFVDGVMAQMQMRHCLGALGPETEADRVARIVRQAGPAPMDSGMRPASLAGHAGEALNWLRQFQTSIELLVLSGDLNGLLALLSCPYMDK